MGSQEQVRKTNTRPRGPRTRKAPRAVAPVPRKPAPEVARKRVGATSGRPVGLLITPALTPVRRLITAPKPRTARAPRRRVDKERRPPRAKRIAAAVRAEARATVACVGERPRVQRVDAVVGPAPRATPQLHITRHELTPLPCPEPALQPLQPLATARRSLPAVLKSAPAHGQLR